MDTARRSGRWCPHPAWVNADRVEAQLAASLASATFPADWRARALAQLGQADTQAEHVRQRAMLTRRLERTKDLYRDGDMDLSTYRAERDRLKRQLAAIPAVDRVARDLQQAHETLSSFGQAWKRATLAQRERLVHLILRRVLIENGSIVAIEPFPDFHALLSTAQVAQFASDGIRSLARQPLLILPPGTARLK